MNKCETQPTQPNQQRIDEEILGVKLLHDWSLLPAEEYEIVKSRLVTREIFRDSGHRIAISTWKWMNSETGEEMSPVFEILSDLDEESARIFQEFWSDSEIRVRRIHFKEVPEARKNIGQETWMSVLDEAHRRETVGPNRSGIVEPLSSRMRDLNSILTPMAPMDFGFFHWVNANVAPDVAKELIEKVVAYKQANPDRSMESVVVTTMLDTQSWHTKRGLFSKTKKQPQ